LIKGAETSRHNFLGQNHKFDPFRNGSSLLQINGILVVRINFKKNLT
jgi:hypothetical protein